MRKKVFWGVIILVVVLIGASFIFRGTGRVTRSMLQKNAQSSAPLSSAQVAQIVKMVGQHIIVPNETPSVGIVTDIAKLVQSQPFYQGAENGDVLLIYPSISRAILFDPDKNVIINVGPVVLDNTTGAQAASTPTLTPSDTGTSTAE